MLAPVSDEGWQTLIDEIRQIIAELEEVWETRRTGAIEVVDDVRRADDAKGNLSKLLNYCTKADRMYFDTFGEVAYYWVFPREKMRTSQREALADTERKYRERLHLELDNIFFHPKNQQFYRFEQEYVRAIRTGDVATQAKAARSFQVILQ